MFEAKKQSLREQLAQGLRNQFSKKGNGVGVPEGDGKTPNLMRLDPKVGKLGAHLQTTSIDTDLGIPSRR